MRTKEHLTVSIDKGLSKEADKILKEMGMKTSSYINVVLRGLVDSQTKTFKEVYENMGSTIAKKVMKKQKTK